MTGQGTVLGDRYRLEEIIGRGGMAEVWRARDLRLDRDVAVKRLRVDLATDPTFQARFRREAQSAAGLNHPNIVAVYDTGEADDPHNHIPVPYIVMELVEGHTLKDVLRDGRKILPERALEFVQGTLDALAYSHRAGIIHRDIKPANVMLTSNGVVKVMDFGIARAVSDTSATMTQTAAVIGTAQYLSPEQARGETVDNRSDIYSAGCLLYELLVSRPPFVGDSPVSVAYQHVREAPVPPSELDPEITPEMDAITLKALAKDPADRYQDAEEMSTDIGRLLAGEPVQAQVPTPLEPVPVWQAQQTAVMSQGQPSTSEPIAAVPAPLEEEPVTRKRNVAILVTMLVVALLLAGGYGVWQVFKPSEPPQAAQVPVPLVTGLSEGAAQSTIINSKLKVGKVTYVNQAEDTKGQVISQNPTGQTMVDEGTEVNITVNRGPKTATIPEGLLRKTQAQATKILTDAGFTVKIEQADPDDEPADAKKGTVTAVNPSEGAEVAEGSEVVLTIATGMSEVPNFGTMTVEEARAEAERKGFRIKVVEEESTQTAGRVMRQDPVAGQMAERGTTITVTIAVPSPTPTQTPTTQSPAPSTQSTTPSISTETPSGSSSPPSTPGEGQS